MDIKKTYTIDLIFEKVRYALCTNLISFCLSYLYNKKKETLTII